MTEKNELGLVADKKEKANTIEDYFRYFKHEEARLPNFDEEITIGVITRDDYEYTQLISAGVTPEEIKSGRVKRGKLLEAGFVFNNQPLFPIEKPLIKVELDGVNYGLRKLLTQDELERVKAYQRQHPDLYGTLEISSDEFRKDMLSFLLASDDNLPSHVREKVNFYRLCINQIAAPFLIRSGKKDGLNMKAEQLYKRLVGLHQKSIIGEKTFFEDQTRFIEDNLADVMLWKVPEDTHKRFNIIARGKKMMLVESRRGKLNNMPSPFLDSGFHFPSQIANPDYTVIGSDGGVFRVNTLVLHLASRNLSEIGDSQKGDGEQDYSIGHFLRDLYEKDLQERKKIHGNEEEKLNLKLNFDQEELMRKVQAKLKSLALIWAEGPDAPEAAKKLANDIRYQERNIGMSFLARVAARWRK